jgi:hemolysin III
MSRPDPSFSPALPPAANHDRDQTLGEEIANSATHGLALLAALIGLPYLIYHAVQQGSIGYTVGTCVFSLTVVLLYLGSTIYHALPAGKAKRVFRVLDHAAIYLLIAGTYTPFTLGVLHGFWGWTLFGIVWGLAAIGVVQKIFSHKPHLVFSTVLYLLMGVAFFATDWKLKYGHFVWHLFVIAGTVCHYFGVLWYAA